MISLRVLAPAATECQLSALVVFAVVATSGNGSLLTNERADFAAAPVTSGRVGYVDEATGTVVRDTAALARSMFLDSAVPLVLAGQFVAFREGDGAGEVVGIMDVERVLKGPDRAGPRVRILIDEGILEADGSRRTRAFERGEDVTTAMATVPFFEQVGLTRERAGDVVFSEPGMTIDDEGGAIRTGETFVLGLAAASSDGADAVDRWYQYLAWGEEARRLIDVFERESALAARCTEWRHPWDWGQAATRRFFRGGGRELMLGFGVYRMKSKVAGIDHVRRCLDDGADPNADLPGGRGPLHWAAGQTHDVEVVRALLEAGAHLELRDASGETPLMYAAGNDRGNAAILNALLDVGASLGGSRSSTPLHRAAANENPEMIRTLVQAGADPNVRAGPSGRTPLHDAARYCGLYEHTQCRDMARRVEELLAAGAELSLRDFGGATALHWAAQGNFNPRSVTALIAAGLSVAARDRHGATPLHYAVRDQGAAVVTALLGAGADADAKDIAGATPLHWASRGRSREFHAVMDALVHAGVRLDARDNNGQTPLHYVGNSRRAIQLIVAGADPTAKDASGQTPSEARGELVGSASVDYRHLWAVGLFDDDSVPDEVFVRPVSFVDVYPRDAFDIRVSYLEGPHRLWGRLSTRLHEPLMLAELDSIHGIGIKTMAPGTYLTACAKGHGKKKCDADEHVRLDRDGVLLFRDESWSYLFHLVGDSFVRTWLSD